jgi:hypothetical protein
MQAIYDSDGNHLGFMPLSESQQKALDANGKVSVLYHTPQLLQHTLGRRSGSFMLYKEGERVIALTSSTAKEFLELQAAIKAAREPN